MRFSNVFTASLVVPLIAAHGGGHFHAAPKILGLPRSDIGALKNRNILQGHEARVARPQGSELVARQAGGDAEGRCGRDNGCATCNPGYCCSPSGYCGNDVEYCQSPDCNFEYGPGCDANQVPAGGSTRNTARTKLGNQEYGGAGIYSCVKAGDVAITYDDGPYIYTDELLNLLATKNAKATFFVTGINLSKGAIDTTSAWSTVIKRMVAEKHQVASHTWSHQDLSAITSAQRYDQMIRNEMALTNILGKFPTYMRPPYSSCTPESGCQKDLADLGYVVSYFDLDTDDYNQLTPVKIQVAKDNVAKGFANTKPSQDSRLTIAHDIHQLTAQNLSSYMINYIDNLGYKMVTLGECMGEPEANWYRTPAARVASTSSFPVPTCTNTASSTAASTSAAAASKPTGVSVDAACGNAAGTTCLGSQFGDCCSPGGWCGSSVDYCGTGCQPGFGKCGISASSSPALVSSALVSSAQSSPAAISSTIRSSTADAVTKASSSTAAAVTKASSSIPAAVSTKASSSSSSSSSTAATSSTKASSAVPSPTPPAAQKVSPDGTCGGAKGYTCSNSRFGNCCSMLNRCGSFTTQCMRLTGCQNAFGDCYFF